MRADDFSADREYLSIQRRRNLPVGESRQEPSGGPEMVLAREPGTELLREPATGLTKRPGNWVFRDGTRKLLQRNVMTGYGKRWALLARPE